jgi:hypothetical protein
MKRDENCSRALTLKIFQDVSVSEGAQLFTYYFPFSLEIAFSGKLHFKPGMNKTLMSMDLTALHY